MFRRFMIVCWVLVGLALVACDEAAFRAKQRINSGSLAAVDSCVDYSKSELVSDEVLRRRCADKHQQVLTLDAVDAYGNFDEWGKLHVVISTQEYVITAVTISVQWIGYPRTKGSMTYRDLWITPDGSEGLEIYPYEVDLDWEIAAHQPVEYLTWSIDSVSGIEITVN